MFAAPELHNCSDYLCDVSAVDMNCCDAECLFRSSKPCDPDIFDWCCLVMSAGGIRPPENATEAVSLYKKLREDLSVVN